MSDKERNKRLCDEMPFLIPHSRWTGDPLDNYDYSYTELDMAEIPSGWDNMLLKFCRELLPILVKYDFEKKFRFAQVKEKFGTLRVYTCSMPKNLADEVYTLIDKYEQISSRTCGTCGKEAHLIDTGGWIIPMCKHCFDHNKYYKGTYEDYICDDEWE